MSEYCVYKHTFPNGKVYIGITSRPPHRRWAKGQGYHQQPLMYRAILKYGWDNIKHEILQTGLSKEDAEQSEIELIKSSKSNQKEFGYNVANGGNTIGTMSEETKKKISQTLKGVPKEKPPFAGKKHTAEAKAKLSAKRKGKNNPMYGKHISEETRLKMSESHKNCSLCKPIICLETGEIFVSASDASRKMGLSQGNISNVARGVRKHTKGFHFEFVNQGGAH